MGRWSAPMQFLLSANAPRVVLRSVGMAHMGHGENTAAWGKAKLAFHTSRDGGTVIGRQYQFLPSIVSPPFPEYPATVIGLSEGGDWGAGSPAGLSH